MPFQITLALIFLYRELGPAVFGGVAILVKSIFYQLSAYHTFLENLSLFLPIQPFPIAKFRNLATLYTCSAVLQDFYAKFNPKVLLIPFNVGMGRLSRLYVSRQMKRKGERIKAMYEILNNIKIIKLNAWEESFQRKIERIRHA